MLYYNPLSSPNCALTSVLSGDSTLYLTVTLLQLHAYCLTYQMGVVNLATPIVHID